MVADTVAGVGERAVDPGRGLVTYGADTGGATFSGLAPGDRLGPLRLTVSAAANERYWSAAGVDHPALAGRCALSADRRQPHRAHLPRPLPRRHDPDPPAPRVPPARRVDVELETTAEVLERYERRGRDYIVVRAETTQDGAPLWTSTVHFTPALVPPNEVPS